MKPEPDFPSRKTEAGAEDQADTKKLPATGPLFRRRSSQETFGTAKNRFVAVTGDGKRAGRLHDSDMAGANPRVEAIFDSNIDHRTSNAERIQALLTRRRGERGD